MDNLHVGGHSDLETLNHTTPEIIRIDNTHYMNWQDMKIWGMMRQITVLVAPHKTRARIHLLPTRRVVDTQVCTMYVFVY